MPYLGLVSLLTHVVVGALWLGAMAYSLVVVQPRLARLAGSAVAAEDSYRELAAGNRWRVVGLLVALGGSGGVLVAFIAGDTEQSTAWWGLMVAKAALFVTAGGLFWWVSWRGWPRRVFALQVELPAQQRRFRQVAVTLLAVVGAGFVLGVVAGWLPT